ncbi:MAG TPA: hypothetical protein EYQ50_28240 [Verrucomicrobiales bacterium]|nr:hypothetical protein [Verrucomicrobiales bacterium]
MDKDEARYILESFRPSGEDSNDPGFREALNRVHLDPALEKEFSEQRLLDAAICRKIDESPVPKDLKMAILAGRKTIPPIRSRGFAGAISIAAAIIFSVFTAKFLINSSSSYSEFDGFRTVMTRDLSQPGFINLKVQGSEYSKLRAWLVGMQSPAPLVLPGSIEHFPPMGCQTQNWKEGKVSLICFVKRGEMLHLFIIDRNTFPDLPGSESPLFAKTGRWSTAGWAEGEKSYLLASTSNLDSLRKVMGGI